MTYEVPIEQGKVREFAVATAGGTPRYADADAPVPPTFLTTAGNFWCPPDQRPTKGLGLDLLRLLHAEEEFSFPGPPPRAGERLTASSRLDDQWTKEGRRGARSASRGSSPSTGTRRARSSPSSAPRSSRRPAHPKEADVPAVGDVAEARTFGPITRTDIVRYAGASGDFNPVHHDEPFAATAGYPTVFSIGMYQASLLASFATEWLGADAVRRFTVRFQEQVWPGDELTCAGRVVEVVQGTDGTDVEVELSCTRQTGGVAIVGSARFLV